ncbi:MAG: hypothetical protein WAL75_07395 [Terracidiphilus sp.]
MSFHFDNLPWTEIVWPCASLLLVVFFIDLIRWFGRFENSAEAVGSDLNLTTFGFAADLLVQLMHGRKILPRWPFQTPVLVLAIGLFIVNLILYMFNLRLAARIAASITAKKKWFVIKFLKFFSFFLGVVSALMFISAQALWD